MKNDPMFKFVAAAIVAAVCTAFYSATHFKTQELYRDAVAARQTEVSAKAKM